VIARVFPRRTKATPDDEHAYNAPPDLFARTKGYTEIHVSVTFTWDIERAEWLAGEWAHIAPVRIGGPATGMAGGEFTPGMYLKKGYVITSRGCPNKCWFCSVWKREGNIRTLNVCGGFNVIDDNLLACPESHIRKVFDMLAGQRERIHFTGGLEAERLRSWHVDLLSKLKPKQFFFAYDEERDYEPLARASRMLRSAGFTRNQMRCYVLLGYPSDKMDRAEERLLKTVKLGFYPMAMLWRDKDGSTIEEWRHFQRLWARPAIIAKRI
jgi:hypothetical protein